MLTSLKDVNIENSSFDEIRALILDTNTERICNSNLCEFGRNLTTISATKNEPKVVIASSTPINKEEKRERISRVVSLVLNSKRFSPDKK